MPIGMKDSHSEEENEKFGEITFSTNQTCYLPEMLWNYNGWNVCFCCNGGWASHEVGKGSTNEFCSQLSLYFLFWESLTKVPRLGFTPFWSPGTLQTFESPALVYQAGGIDACFTRLKFNHIFPFVFLPLILPCTFPTLLEIHGPFPSIIIDCMCVFLYTCIYSCR